MAGQSSTASLRSRPVVFMHTNAAIWECDSACLISARRAGRSSSFFGQRPPGQIVAADHGQPGPRVRRGDAGMRPR